MDIFVNDGRFMVGMFARFKYEWADDGTLSVWGSAASYAHVTTNRGTFVEAVDAEDHLIAEGGDGNWCYVPVGEKPIRLRIKSLPDPELTIKQIDKERQNVTRHLFCDKPYNLPDTLPAMIEWMKGRLEEIPEACRENTRFSFDTTMEYGETYPEVEITYTEAETNEEVVRRIQIERERARIKEVAEREQLQALQAKFAAA